jgi:hypothetical protein
MHERPGHFDWEILADADAELQAWHEIPLLAYAAIDTSAAPANDTTRSAA